MCVCSDKTLLFAQKWKYPSQYQYFWTDFFVCVCIQRKQCYFSANSIFTHWNFSTKCEYLLNKHLNPAFPPLRSTAQYLGKRRYHWCLSDLNCCTWIPRLPASGKNTSKTATVWNVSQKDSMGQNTYKGKSIHKYNTQVFCNHRDKPLHEMNFRKSIYNIQSDSSSLIKLSWRGAGLQWA